MSTNPAILLEGLGKVYPAQGSIPAKEALKDFNLAIPKGSIYGLLGPNGAGKSTLINILAGTVTKTSGKAYISGIDIDTHAKLAKYRIGVVPQEPILDTFFPVREALEFYAGYYSIKPSDRKTDQILEALGLTEKANVTSRQLSGGMKRRFLVAKAMVHSPEVLILDEPTAGVDIELRDQLWEYVKKLNEAGTTIILTTHYLKEAEELCDYIAFINHGKLIKNDSKTNLLNSLTIRDIIITCAEQLNNIQSQLIQYQAQLIEPNKIKLQYNTTQISLGLILNQVSEAQLTITDLNLSQSNLEDIFRKLMH